MADGENKQAEEHNTKQFREQREEGGNFYAGNYKSGVTRFVLQQAFLTPLAPPQGETMSILNNQRLLISWNRR